MSLKHLSTARFLPDKNPKKLDDSENPEDLGDAEDLDDLEDLEDGLRQM